MAKKNTPLTQNREVLQTMSEAIETTFASFDVPIKIVDAIEGYRYYHFTLQPQTPVRMKTIRTFEDDLRYALGSDAVTIAAPIPNQKLVGITVPKQGSFPVLPWAEEITTKAFKDSGSLVVPLGVDEFGQKVTMDIAQLPHLLIAGATGAGKSVLLHSLINSLLVKHTPETLRFILCDPKRVELTVYNDLPELMTPVITSEKKMLLALKWAQKEMERRYDILHSAQVQNIAQYHTAVYQPSRKKKRANEVEPLPYLMIIVDEAASLVQAYPKEFESAIVRIAQMGHVVGIHLVLATQMPASNVLTGAIKASIPARVALRVASYVDSRMILEQNGAEKLTGRGDLLFLTMEEPQPTRLQACAFTPVEVAARVSKLKKEWHDHLGLDEQVNANHFFGTYEGEEDELYEKAKQAVIEAGKASTSFLQRKLKLGYSRSAALMDLLEARGVIAPQEGAAPRKVYED